MHIVQWLCVHFWWISLALCVRPFPKIALPCEANIDIQIHMHMHTHTYIYTHTYIDCQATLFNCLLFAWLMFHKTLIPSSWQANKLRVHRVIWFGITYSSSMEIQCSIMLSNLANFADFLWNAVSLSFHNGTLENAFKKMFFGFHLDCIWSYE